MKKILTMILVLFCFVLSAQQHFDTNLSPDELKKDFKIFESTLTSIHPNLYLYTSKEQLDSMLKSTEKKLNDHMNPVEFYRLITPIIHFVRNAHTTIKPPQGYLDFVNSDAKRLPMSFIYRNDSLIVLKNYSKNSTIKTGDLISKINDISASNLIDSLGIFTFVDGYNKKYSDYLSSTFLSKRYAYFIDLPSSFSIEYFDSKGTLNKEIINPLSVKEFYKEEQRDKATPKYSLQIKDGIAYLTINDFIIGNAKKFSKDLDKYFNEINNKEIEHLVLDLRNNNGGNPEATNALLSFLINERVYPIKEKFSIIDKLSKNDHFLIDDVFKYFNKAKKINSNNIYLLEKEMNVSIKPTKTPYQGHLIILINENCASATTSFLGQIRTHIPEATFVGRTTLGNPYIVVADFTVSLKLPNSNIIVKIPLISSEKNVNFENPKGGVIPDVKVPISIESELHKTDEIKNRAIEIILEQKKTGHNNGNRCARH